MINSIFTQAIWTRIISVKGMALRHSKTATNTKESGTRIKPMEKADTGMQMAITTKDIGKTIKHTAWDCTPLRTAPVI